ncbi:SseB family protein [Methanobrevibacter sp. V74]|uniref:SseB family protein n=1 Tax=Methanobrevibacter sp. V74 TaxID=3064279 RepID=UPI0027360FED|nr:SseB family protein [Methanobrevibacter sp. V74]
MNKKLKELISIPECEASSKDDELLVEELKKAQLIMPIEIISADALKNSTIENIEEPLRFKPLKIADDNENQFIALFSDEDEVIKSNVEFDVINIYTENLAEIIQDSDGEYFGIAINPFSKFSLAIPLNEFIELF